jgi:hypothetical protein
VSLHSISLNLDSILSGGLNQSTDRVVHQFKSHLSWDCGKGWKNILNNLRLILQPYQFFNSIKLWLRVFPISQLSIGFSILIALMNHLDRAIRDPNQLEELLFSSA